MLYENLTYRFVLANRVIILGVRHIVVPVIRCFVATERWIDEQAATIFGVSVCHCIVISKHTCTSEFTKQVLLVVGIIFRPVGIVLKFIFMKQICEISNLKYFRLTSDKEIVGLKRSR